MGAIIDARVPEALAAHKLTMSRQDTPTGPLYRAACSCGCYKSLQYRTETRAGHAARTHTNMMIRRAAKAGSAD